MVDDLEDIKTDTEKQNLNIVLVLEASGEGQQATKLARKFAQQYLDRAISLAESLPEDAGSLLSEFALVLGKRLKTD